MSAPGHARPAAAATPSTGREIRTAHSAGSQACEYAQAAVSAKPLSIQPPTGTPPEAVAATRVGRPTNPKFMITAVGGGPFVRGTLRNQLSSHGPATAAIPTAVKRTAPIHHPSISKNTPTTACPPSSMDEARRVHRPRPRATPIAITVPKMSRSAASSAAAESARGPDPNTRTNAHPADASTIAAATKSGARCMMSIMPATGRHGACRAGRVP